MTKSPRFAGSFVLFLERMAARIVLSLIWFCSLTHGLWAQTATKYLYQLKPGLIKEISLSGVKGKHIQIDAYFRLWQFETNSDIPEDQIIRNLWAHPHVQLAQKIRPVSRRRIPNDPLFGLQAFQQTISAPQAWNKGVGGLTVKGDTIVIAVVDDGMDTSHPDLLANTWYNFAEKPYNGIDDDNNGYIDDYRGWNGGDSNARTFTNQSLYAHGTEVAGIIGARGNNNIGVAGINWNIKIMPLVCYPENGVDGDLGVIRSMIYALKMKKAWLQSGGKKGALIVSMNTSVGISGLFPADEPIWCAMYDSLGHYGILSSLATDNSDDDVGVKGDIPSLCPSDYTIVTSCTDANDNRVPSGYSAIHVDMGAPGYKVYSTNLSSFGGANGPYSQESGTSFAAPQVGAAAAWLVSVAGDSFCNLLKTHPDSSARLLKNWLMKGVVKLPSLAGKCVSEGRLDLYKSWQAMDAWRVPEKKSNVYPNPISVGSWLHFAESISPKSRFELISTSGNTSFNGFSDHSGKIRIPEVAPAVYWIKVWHENTIIVKKICIVN